MFVGACAQRKIAGRRLQDMMATRKANAAARAMWRSSRQRQRVRLTRLALCNATSTTDWGSEMRRRGLVNKGFVIRRLRVVL